MIKNRGDYSKLSGLLCLFLVWLLSGCTGLGVTTLTGLQFNQIVEENNQRAQNAMAAAQGQDCAAAQPYREAAASAAAQSAALASQSAALMADSRNAFRLQGQISDFLNQSRQRITESWNAYDSARAQFERNFGPGVLVLGSQNLANVIADAGAYTDAMLKVGRAYETAAMDLEMLVREMGGQADKYLPEGTNLGAMAADFKTRAKEQLDQIISYASTPYDVPSDTNILVDQIPNTSLLPGGSMQYKFLVTMQNHYLTGSSLAPNNDRGGNPVARQWNAVQSALESAAGKSGAGGSIQAAILEMSNRIAAITDETQVLSAEATRNAWLAVEACGGPLPADLPPLASPFDGRPGMIPGWNSTFWDISSP